MSDSTSPRVESPVSARTAPRVLIVGRPNVGKSTLFNRLVGRRRAITDSTPGVTRDPVEDNVNVYGQSVRLIDTGGYRIGAGGLDEIVSARSVSELAGARVVLFVVDVMESTAEDEALMEMLRSVPEKVILVVNKVDGPERDAAVWNFYRYGFPVVVGVSAEHRRRLDDLMDAIAAKLADGGGDGDARAGGAGAADEPPAAEEEAADPPPASPHAGMPVRIAILGKPNTGKSTLMNRLAGRDVSIVSEVPGTTRDVIPSTFEHDGRTFTLLDTAGIRRKNRINSDLEYYSVHRAVESIEDSDIVLLMIDSLDNVTDQDKKIAQLVVAKGKGIIVLLNKWDLLKPVANLRYAMEDRVRFLFPVLQFAPILPLSAKNGDGIPRLLKTVGTMWEQLNHTADTSRLNRAMKNWNDHYSPPRAKKTQYKVRYITQTGTNPVSFVLFVNKSYRFPAPWVQYLVNRIRAEFGFAWIPLEITVRQ